MLLVIISQNWLPDDASTNMFVAREWLLTLCVHIVHHVAVLSTVHRRRMPKATGYQIQQRAILQTCVSCRLETNNDASWCTSHVVATRVSDSSQESPTITLHTKMMVRRTMPCARHPPKQLRRKFLFPNQKLTHSSEWGTREQGRPFKIHRQNSPVITSW